MRDIYECDPEFPLHALELKLHLFTHLEVQSSQRLVEQEYAGAVYDGPCDRNSLHLSAGELVDVSLAVVGKSDRRERLVYALLDLGLCYLLDLEAERNVVKNVEVREKSISLKYSINVSFICGDLQKVLALEIDHARISGLKSRDDAQRC